MKEIIEKKLGYTIEEYYNRIVAMFEEGNILEGESPNPYDKLTLEEGRFMEEYVRRLAAA